jgi:hypothetical protein
MIGVRGSMMKPFSPDMPVEKVGHMPNEGLTNLFKVVKDSTNLHDFYHMLMGPLPELVKNLDIILGEEAKKNRNMQMIASGHLIRGLEMQRKMAELYYDLQKFGVNLQWRA